MKKYTTIIFLFFFTFLFNTKVFADDPVDNGAGYDIPTAPIDDYVWVLAILGFIYIFMKLKSIQNKKIQN